MNNKKRKGLILKFLNFLKPLKMLCIVTFVIIFIVTVLNVFQAYVIKNIVDTAVLRDLKNLTNYTIIIIILFVFTSVFFGKAHGYCRGVGGGMHIADFELGHLGANAIVGGHVPIAVGAAMSVRYKKDKDLILCLAGDGSFSNGVVLESLNIAAMAQFKNGLMESKSGLPIIFGIVNNQYAMSGQSAGEITGIDFMARRAAGFDTDLMHAEVVDGMDVLAVADSVKRAKVIIREGHGPVLL